MYLGGVDGKAQLPIVGLPTLKLVRRIAYLWASGATS